MVGNIVRALLMVATCALISGMLFPPGDVPRQLFVVGIWFASGFAVSRLWD